MFGQISAKILSRSSNSGSGLAVTGILAGELSQQLPPVTPPIVQSTLIIPSLMAYLLTMPSTNS